MRAEESATVCVPVPLKVTARPLGVNVPVAVLRVQLPPSLKSPPDALERVSVPLMLTLPVTMSGCVIAGEPLRFIVEPLSIVRLPANWKNAPEAPLGRLRLVLLLSCTLTG